MRIPGEYPSVTRSSRQRDLLRKAHETPISKHEACLMVMRIKEFHNLPDFSLAFGRRGMGGTRLIVLPEREMTNVEVQACRLRVGVILHEMAHMIRGHVGHGTHDFEFVVILDKMLTRWANGDYERR